MKWSEVFDDSRNPTTEYEVLKGLRPHHKLRKLKILFYGGVEFPSWIGDPSFDRLIELSLFECRSCTHLQTLGKLPSLKALYVRNMDDMTSGFELLTTTSSFKHIAFPSLEVLEVHNVKGWERCSISGCDNDGTAGSFPSLHHISLRGCPELSEVSVDSIPSLRDLYIVSCEKLASLKEVNMGISMESGRKVTLRNCKELQSYNCPNNIESLLISNGASMTSLTFPTVQDLPSSLKTLQVKSCENLEESWLLNNFLSSLESLIIFNCDNMRSFPEGCFFVHLITLKIKNCDNIESILEKGIGFLPLFCLKYLTISECKNLKSLPLEHLQSLTSLERLSIHDCPSINYSFPCGLWPLNLRSLRKGCLNKPISEWGLQNYPTSLVQLKLYGEKSGVVSFAKAEDHNNNSTNSSSFLLPPSLTFLKVIGFEDLESVSMGLQHLLSLERFDIESCPKLRDLPKTTTPGSSSLRVTRR